MENFREIAAAFDRAGAWRRVADGAELGAVFAGWLDDAASARALGARGAELVATHRGALERTLAWIAPVLEPAGVADAAGAAGSGDGAPAA
jgi:3-deoxy-D-manno-octulosonic-acid transferase